jgi:hypothetical protein
MLLAQDIQQIAKDIAAIKNLMFIIPNWIPLSDEVAKEYGYATTNGLRNYCKRNIEPSLFKKFGKTYHIHKSALCLLKTKSQVVNV